MEKEGVWSHGISSSLMRLFSLRGMRERRGLAGMCPWAVLAVTSLQRVRFILILMFCFSHALFLHPSPTCLVMAEAWAEMPGAVTQLLAAGGFAVCGPALLGARRASCALFVLATHCKPLSPSELWHSHIHTCISFVLAIWGDFSCFRRFKQTM